MPTYEVKPDELETSEDAVLILRKSHQGVQETVELEAQGLDRKISDSSS